MLLFMFIVALLPYTVTNKLQAIPPLQSQQLISEECPICYESLQVRAATFLQCTQTVTHPYHTQCLLDWLKEKRNEVLANCCPTCRRSINPPLLPEQSIITNLPTIIGVSMIRDFALAWSGVLIAFSRSVQDIIIPATILLTCGAYQRFLPDYSLRSRYCPWYTLVLASAIIAVGSQFIAGT
jgi:hypothetical protein